VRIGALAREIGVSADTIRFYERAGLLPRPSRHENNYREYGPADVDHLRLLIDLRRMDMPLELAAEMATWCHSGHCAETANMLPSAITARRLELADRMQRLRDLDDRLSTLEEHLARTRIELTVLDAGGPCCSAAATVTDLAAGSCACCAPAAAIS